MSARIDDWLMLCSILGLTLILSSLVFIVVSLFEMTDVATLSVVPFPCFILAVVVVCWRVATLDRRLLELERIACVKRA